MPQDSIAPLVSLLVVLVVVGFIASVFRGRLATVPLVLQQFLVDQPTGRVTIVGRRAGTVAWLMTRLGLDSTTSLYTTPQEIRFRNASLFGETDTVIPVSQCASLSCGYRRPVSYLIAAALMLIAAAVLFAAAAQATPPTALRAVALREEIQILKSLGFLSLILSGVMFIAYALSKRILLYFESTGGTHFGMMFRRSVIENIPVDIAKARLAVQIVSWHIVYRDGSANVRSSTYPDL